MNTNKALAIAVPAAFVIGMFSFALLDSMVEDIKHKRSAKNLDEKYAAELDGK